MEATTLQRGRKVQRSRRQTNTRRSPSRDSRAALATARTARQVGEGLREGYEISKPISKDTRTESSSLKQRPRCRLAGPHVNLARERSGRQPQQRSMRPQCVQRRPARRTRPRHKAERLFHDLVGQLLCRGREVVWRGRNGILLTPSDPWP